MEKTRQPRLIQTMRWYGPNDIVSLRHIRQAGCEEVVSALHQIPVGEVWTISEINNRLNMIEKSGLGWSVVESLPVHEDIKKGKDRYQHYIDNYKISLRNLAACGLKVITYNFMPILDWLRTDIAYELPGGALTLRFERLAFIAFDLFLLKRPDAELDYSEKERQLALTYFEGLGLEDRSKIFKNCLLGLPGSDVPFTPEEVLDALKGYRHIDSSALKENLFHFLQAVIPVAEEEGLKLAIHPDDPPYPVLGLPRIVSTEQDVQDLLDAVPSNSNGLCFCTGSYGVRADNDLPAMLNRFGDRVHFLHIRNTRRYPNGDFEEADHLGGDTDMAEIIVESLRIMARRGERIPMRPDHGHQILDDLNKKAYPGYTAIGRLKGLAELRGLEYGLIYKANQVEGAE